MKAEAYLFAGVAVFFAVVASIYAGAHLEPAGTAALTMSFLMSALISLFCWVRYTRKGPRTQDRKEADIHEGAGPLGYFPPHSYAPVVSAAGVTVIATGVVYGSWLALIGVGVLAPGVAGFVFGYKDHTV